MKTKILLLLIASLMFSYKTSYGQTNENNTEIHTADKINARLIICSGLSEKNVPLDDLKEINIKEDGKVILYVKWFKKQGRLFLFVEQYL